MPESNIDTHLLSCGGEYVAELQVVGRVPAVVDGYTWRFSLIVGVAVGLRASAYWRCITTPMTLDEAQKIVEAAYQMEAV